MKGIPKSEIRRTTYNFIKGTYVITSKPDNSTFFLYRVKNETATKMGKAKTPICLEEAIFNEL